MEAKKRSCFVESWIQLMMPGRDLLVQSDVPVAKFRVLNSAIYYILA